MVYVYFLYVCIMCFFLLVFHHHYLQKIPRCRSLLGPPLPTPKKVAQAAVLLGVHGQGEMQGSRGIKKIEAEIGGESNIWELLSYSQVVVSNTPPGKDLDG